MVWKRVWLCLIAMLPIAALAEDSADAVLNAQRKVAGELLRVGKVDEAIQILVKVSTDSRSTYKDFQSLAGAYEKSGQKDEAINNYRQAMRTLVIPKSLEEAAAKKEIERKLKSLDPFASAIENATDTYLKSLDSIAKDAASKGDKRTTEKILAIRSAVLKSTDKLESFAIVAITATKGWQAAGIDVVAGETYQVVAEGTWTMDDKGTVRTTADGQKSLVVHDMPVGCLMGCIGEQPPAIRLGQNITFKVDKTGPLYLACNDDKRDDNKGTISVRITRVK